MSDLLTLSGIGTGTVGVILVFLFGMPFRVAISGDIVVVDKKPADKQKDDLYRLVGWAGLILILIGAGLQAASVFMD